MSAYPIASAAADALLAEAATARTQAEAEALARGPVFLDVEVLPAAYDSIAAAERALPQLYLEPRFELVWAQEAWRIAVRFWRPAPPAPVSHTVAGAVRRPLAFARTPEEARAALGAPAELALEVLPKRYKSHGTARAAQRKAFEAGCARVVERDGAFAVAISFWRPIPSAPRPAMTPAERRTVMERSAAPLTGPLPQASPFVGLFERLAPENDAIVLAEEGDGRGPGD